VTAGAPASARQATRAGAGLRVGGFTPFTNIDFPGRLSAVVFVQGCPWRCGYCHNPHLQPRAGGTGPAWTEVLAFLERRIDLLDAVVFSGGEPTIDRALAEAIRVVRARGFQIGLHSAGMYPRRLADVLPLVDWVGLDIKAPLDDPGRHDRVTGIVGGVAKVRESVEAVLRSGARHEFRTTAHPSLLGDDDLLRIGGSLASMGARAFALQVARPVRERAAPLACVGPGYPAKATLDGLSALFPSFVLRRD
jgi:pyruvate formate lyase activating enzyme